MQNTWRSIYYYLSVSFGYRVAGSRYQGVAAKTAFTLLAGILLLSGQAAFAQIVPGDPTVSQRDTANKKNTTGWVDEVARITWTRAYSQVKHYQDSSIHTFHRRAYEQPWYQTLGNHGAPARNLLFTPITDVGLSLGYHTMDIYRYIPDSIFYYNTTKPYTVFDFQLGSKLEQLAGISHTQNIKPNWNVSIQYRKTTSPGYYRIQRNNHDNAALTTNYQSTNLHYQLFGSLVYNKEQHDENGGITSADYLTQSLYSDKTTIPVQYQNDAYSTRRSSVTNNLRDVNFLLQHSYTVGQTDTLYNEDSTKYSFKLIPRFSLSHRMELSSERYDYRDMRPDSARYTTLFHTYIPTSDSVTTQQNWFRLDNRFLLNGFFGKEGNQLRFSAGIGNRIDQFNTLYATGKSSSSSFGNYLYGSLLKEELAPGQWHYGADAQLYFTGLAAGNFLLSATLGKSLGAKWGEATLGFSQQLTNAPYNYTIHQTKYDALTFDFGKQTVTQVYARLNLERIHSAATLRNYVIGNYFYVDETQRPAQYGAAFNFTQLSVNKIFYFGSFVLDNELALQQATANAPIHVPLLMGRHQLSLERYILHHALKVAVGAQVQYNTAYYADGYSPLLMRFYYQTSQKINNTPIGTVFMNMKIKAFRCYISFDQVQTFFVTNNFAAANYPTQNAMLRFGFSWVLVN